MSWTFTAVFGLQVLAVVAVLVLVPSGAATVATVRGLHRGGTRGSVRALATASYSFSAVVLVALTVFLLSNQIRIVGLSQL